MKSIFTLGRDYALKTVAFVLLWCFGNVALAQTTFFFADFPYDSNNLPQDYSKSVYGPTMAEVCSQRTDWEIYFGFGNPPSQLAYVGYLAPGTPNGSCGFKQFNTPPAPPGVNTTGTIPPNTRTCGDILFIASQVPNAAVPQACFTQCPQDQKGPDGICRLHSDKNSGLQCPLCNNPVNPATGNKLQVEVDLAEATAGGISLTRYYNSGRLSPLTKVFGGSWQHTYSRRISLGGANDRASYYAKDGRVLVFNLVAGVWRPDADIADTLVELKDANGVTRQSVRAMA